MKQICMGVTQYIGDFVYFPRGENTYLGDWAWYISPYIGLKETDHDKVGYAIVKSRLFLCPANNKTNDGTAYGLNALPGCAGGFNITYNRFLGGLYGSSKFIDINSTRLKYPTKLIVTQDSCLPYAGIYVNSNRYSMQGLYYLNWWGWDNGWDRPLKEASKIHSSRMNVSFADGHAELVNKYSMRHWNVIPCKIVKPDGSGNIASDPGDYVPSWASY